MHRTQCSNIVYPSSSSHRYQRTSDILRFPMAPLTFISIIKFSSISSATLSISLRPLSHQRASASRSTHPHKRRNKQANGHTRHTSSHRRKDKSQRTSMGMHARAVHVRTETVCRTPAHAHCHEPPSTRRLFALSPSAGLCRSLLCSAPCKDCRNCRVRSLSGCLKIEVNVMVSRRTARYTRDERREEERRDAYFVTAG